MFREGGGKGGIVYTRLMISQDTKFSTAVVINIFNV